MYTISWDNTITALFNFLSSLSWPIIVLIILYIFKSPISKLLASLKTIKYKDLTLDFGDKIKVFSPTEDKFLDAILQPAPVPTEKARKVGITRLSAEEIEQSRQRAQQRLDEDTKKVGYQRGKLYQTDSGKWAIAWHVEISTGLVVSSKVKADF